jgi:hypothetical protein
MIPNSHISIDEFKDTLNAALAKQLNEGHYDEVKVLLLNWKDNDIGLKKPEAGSLILDETKMLMEVFQKYYRYDTEHYLIPSVNPQTKLQTRLSIIIEGITDQKSMGKKPLLILYYNGHGTMKDGKLIWSA